MKNIRFLVAFWMVLLALLATGCVVNVSDDDAFDGGTVVVKNDSNKSFKGTVRTNSKVLFNGTIHAKDSKVFRISDKGTVYTEFESDNGGVSNPSGYVSNGRLLILDL